MLNQQKEESNMIADQLTRFAVLEGPTPEESGMILQRCETINVKKG